MNEKVFTVSEIKAAQEKVRERRMERIMEENDGKKAFATMIMLADADLFADEIIAVLTGNEKAENN